MPDILCILVHLLKSFATNRSDKKLIRDQTSISDVPEHSDKQIGQEDVHEQHVASKKHVCGDGIARIRCF